MRLVNGIKWRSIEDREESGEEVHEFSDSVVLAVVAAAAVVLSVT